MAAPSASANRSAWLKQLHQWHWISSALCLIGMLLFSVTGITLNHAADIAAQPEVTLRKGQLPAPLLQRLRPAADEEEERKAPLPPELRGWLADALQLRLDERDAEWSPEEIYLPLPRPGGDAWLRVQRDSGAVEYELTERGWISYFNDLHKGRHTGTAWSWFIDIFAVACLVFSITGLLILKMHATNRPSTWPMVGLGLLLPLLLALLFIH
jgi:hypothetical protein